MSTTLRALFAIERASVAGVIGAVAGLTAATVVTGFGVADPLRPLAIGVLTAVLFLVLVVAVNAVRLRRA